MKILKLFTLILVGICLLVISFYLGSMHKTKSSSDPVYTNLFRVESGFKAYADYVTFTEISKFLSEGKVVEAKCYADIRVNSDFKDLEKCFNNKQCKIQIKKEIENRNPDLIWNGKLVKSINHNTKPNCPSNWKIIEN